MDPENNKASEVSTGRRAFLLGGGNLGKYLAPALLAVVATKESAGGY